MPDFWDLPRNVRDKIYRMHLVHDKPITENDHDEMCQAPAPYPRHKRVPVLLQVSDRAEREAAPIYYGENHFVFAWLSPVHLVDTTFPRHRRLVQKVTCDWQPTMHGASYAFEYLTKLKGLRELTIKVDEKHMVQHGLNTRDTRQYYANAEEPETYSGQEQLAVYRFPGITGLLSLHGITHINFVPRADGRGPIPGGVLLTQIGPKITAPAPKNKNGKSAAKKGSLDKIKKGKAAHFEFLELPPELRNNIYCLLLGIDGPIHPSKKAPSSTAKITKNRSDVSIPKSALCLLAVNKQIRDEAVGIYYAAPFVFYFSSQFHAFAVDLGQLRRSVIRDITIHYDNAKRGGIDSAELTVPLLRDFTGLKRLHIIMYADLSCKIHHRRYPRSGYKMDLANPALVPGLKALFSLRNIEDIKIRDAKLEEMYETAKKSSKFPDFDGQTQEYHVVKLTAAMEHFNKALLDAQKGRVNEELLQDNKWHTWDDFPELAEEEESDEEGEADEDEVAEEQQRVTEHVEAGQGDGNDTSTGSGTGDAPVKGPRRSARLSAKAAEVTTTQQDDAEDMEVDDVDYGRGASPEL